MQFIKLRIESIDYWYNKESIDYFTFQNAYFIVKFKEKETDNRWNDGAIYYDMPKSARFRKEEHMVENFKEVLMILENGI